MRRVYMLVVSAALSTALAARAQTQPDSEELVLQFARVLPAVASTPGAGGSFFKTSLQLFNPYATPLTGKLVFHPFGVSGTSTDPSMGFNLEAGQSVAYDDVVVAMGQAGLGTLDINVPNASAPPIVVARVFNDGGDAGTSGFTEEAVSPAESGSGSRVLKSNTTGYLVIPPDLTAFRFNIGVRTFANGVSVSIFVVDPDGHSIFFTQKRWDANTIFQQEGSALVGTALPPGGTLRLQVQSGTAIIYGATADNTTQDPSLQYSRVTP
jgi:hypothetical protein